MFLPTGAEYAIVGSLLAAQRQQPAGWCLEPTCRLSQATELPDAPRGAPERLRGRALCTTDRPGGVLQADIFANYSLAGQGFPLSIDIFASYTSRAKFCSPVLQKRQEGHVRVTPRVG